MIKDIALTVDDTGAFTAHRVDCQVVEHHRTTNRPVITMLGIKKPVPSYTKRHECLNEVGTYQSASGAGSRD